VGPARRDDNGLFEKITLEAFQSGLSWLTILRKRDAFRAAFDGFDIERVGPGTARPTSTGCWPTPGSCATGPRSRPPSTTLGQQSAVGTG
jgi:hypothetical protein